MRRLVGVAALLACEMACTHPRRVGPNGQGLGSRVGQKGEVTTRDGKVIEATPRLIRGKRLFVPEDGSPALDLAAVDHVSYDSTGRGAIDGAALGLLLGAVVGVVVAPQADTESNYDHNGGSVVLAGAGIGGLVGAVVGVIVGVVDGSTYEYRISPRP